MRYLSNIYLCVDVELSPIKNSAKEYSCIASSDKPEMNCLEWKQMLETVSLNCCNFEQQLLQKRRSLSSSCCKKGEVSCKIEFH